jgi:HK97 family phage prohead protease
VTESERRYTPGRVEVRAADSDKRTVGGYAAKFNKPSQNLGGFIEVIDPRAFNDARGRDWPEVMARYNHDDNMLLGTTAALTLRLSTDGTGLVYEVDMPQARADVYELVQRGDVNKSSFAFRAIEEDWGMSEQDFPQRTLLSVQLVDVAPVNTPAYLDTSAGLRSLAAKVDAPLDEVRKLAEQNDLRKFFVRTDTRGVPVPKVHTISGAQALMQLRAASKNPVT